MKGRMLIFLTLCAFACAMVVRNKRNATEARYCAPATPCAWDVYGTETHIVETTITNEYCQCDPATSCEVYQDDTAGFIHVYRCLPRNSSKTGAIARRQPNTS